MNMSSDAKYITIPNLHIYLLFTFQNGRDP